MSDKDWHLCFKFRFTNKLYCTKEKYLNDFATKWSSLGRKEFISKQFLKCHYKAIVFTSYDFKYIRDGRMYHSATRVY